MRRVPSAQRIRTKYLGGAVDGEDLMANGVPYGPKVRLEWVVQDDIKVVGLEIINEINALDAHRNADFHCQMITELSRGGVLERDGSLGCCQLEFGWTATIALGGGNGGQRNQLCIMFPQGYGVEIDEGEVLNMLKYASYIGGSDVLTYSSVIVYYVER